MYCKNIAKAKTPISDMTIRGTHSEYVHMASSHANSKIIKLSLKFLRFKTCKIHVTLQFEGILFWQEFCEVHGDSVTCYFRQLCPSSEIYFTLITAICYHNYSRIPPLPSPSSSPHIANHREFLDMLWTQNTEIKHLNYTGGCIYLFPSII